MIHGNKYRFINQAAKARRSLNYLRVLSISAALLSKNAAFSLTAVLSSSSLVLQSNSSCTAMGTQKICISSSGLLY